VSDGKKSEYDEFWDVISSNWTRTTWSQAFKCWSCEYIHPPKQIKPTAESIHVFAANPTLKKIEKKYFDFSGMPINSAQDLYQGCPSLETIEDVGLPAMRNYNYIFNNCTALKTIECLRFSNETTTAVSSFYYCNALESITIEGEICISLNFQWSTKLSKESIISIVTHLSDTQGATLTLSKTAVDNAFMTEDGTLGSTSDEWLDLIKSKASTITGGESNEDKDSEHGLWTISLV
jgi:hypothetical protein